MHSVYKGINCGQLHHLSEHSLGFKGGVLNPHSCQPKNIAFSFKITCNQTNFFPLCAVAIIRFSVHHK